MCDPVSLMAAASLGTGLMSVKSANDAKKARKKSADEAEANAREEKTTQDLATRDARAADYASRSRSASASRPRASGFGLFSPRSFFSVN